MLLQSTLRAHGSVTEKDIEERSARSIPETLRARFKRLEGECDKAFNAVLPTLDMASINPEGPRVRAF